MGIQKERAAFEKLQLGNGVTQLHRGEDGGYQSASLDYCWHIWIKSAETKLAEINQLKERLNGVETTYRTDFEIIKQTIELVDLLASSTNVFQRDPKSSIHCFESKNPRVVEWWRIACEIQELLTNTDPENCDFEEYKILIEAQEPSS